MPVSFLYDFYDFYWKGQTLKEWLQDDGGGGKKENVYLPPVAKSIDDVTESARA